MNENHIQKHTESVIFQHFHVVCNHSVEVWRHIACVTEKIKYEQLISGKNNLPWLYSPGSAKEFLGRDLRTCSKLLHITDNIEYV